MVMARFTHRDSRAGDPDLHTHVAVSNKVQTLDGRWLALDARMLYRFNVAGSEYYNTALEAELTAALGVSFSERPDDSGKRPVREITGVDPRLNQEWSSRAAAITRSASELQSRFLADHGRVPTTVEMISLRQRANLSTRQAKHEPRSLNEQRAAWHDQAVQVLGDDRALDDMIANVLSAESEPAAVVDVSLLEDLTTRTVETVAAHRAQWRESNVHAEALRVVRGRFTDPGQALRVAEAITRRAVAGEYSTPIGMDTEITAQRPTELSRSDGQSVYRVAKAQLYTSPAVLAAEARIVTAAGTHRRPPGPGRGCGVGGAGMVRQHRRAGVEHRAGRDGPGDRHQRPPGAAGVGAGRNREDHRDGCPRRRLAQRRRHRRRVGAAGQRRAGTRRRHPRRPGGHPGQTGPRPHHPHPRQMAAVDDRHRQHQPGDRRRGRVGVHPETGHRDRLRPRAGWAGAAGGGRPATRRVRGGWGAAGHRNHPRRSHIDRGAAVHRHHRRAGQPRAARR